jgi:hypothetical protein
MNINELPYGVIATLELRRTRGEPFPGPLQSGVEVDLVRVRGLAETSLRVLDQAWDVVGAGPADDQALDELFAQNLPRLVWLTTAQPAAAPTGVLLKVHRFARQFAWSESMEVGIDEGIVEDLQKRFLPERRSLTPDGAASWFAEQMLLPPRTTGGPNRAFVSAGPALGADARAFRLQGLRVAADVQVSADGRLLITRLVRTGKQGAGDRHPVLLAEVPVRFMDSTVAGRFRGAAKTQLDQIIHQSGSYLEIWNRWNQLEAEVIAEKHRQIGAFAYESWEPASGGHLVFRLKPADGLDDRLNDLRSRIEAEPDDKTALEAGPEIPQRLLAPAAAPPPVEDDPDQPRKRKPRGPRLFSASCRRGSVDLADRCIRLKRGERDEGLSPPESGFLYPSDAGDRTRLERRTAAHVRIATATGPMPQLGLLLEDQEVPLTRQRFLEPMSPRVRRLFKQPPTPAQIAAIRVAINTPDIALIQGPPGTGKTTVITAIQTRLAELADAEEGLSGMILLTSFQHDAVETAAARTVVHGVPAMTLSRRHGSSEDLAVQRARDWAEVRIRRVRERLGQLPVSGVFLDVHARVFGYLNDPPDEARTAELLDGIRDRTQGLIPEELRDQLVVWARRLKRGLGTDDEAAERLDKALRAVKGLRTDPPSFGDDGPLRAGLVLQRLEPLGVLDEATRGLLRLAHEWPSPETPPFLAALAALREQLDRRLLAAVQPAGRRSNVEVEKLLSDVLTALDLQIRQSQDGVAGVLTDYLNDLENDPEGMAESLVRSTAVLASTCNSAAGRSVSQVKGPDPIYDTVIVDEAARANPMDLLIPTGQARRRIIYVGDHRQLAHLLEELVFAKLGEGASEEIQLLLKQSLFERLFQQLRRRQEAGGVERVVTLNQQFRMHPLLGDFVSAQFYAPFGEGFTSPRPAEQFAHALPGYEGKAAAWLDVPLSAGRETGGRSKTRRVEARRLADEVARLIRTTEDLTFGVIGFYSAQVAELCEELHRVGLMDKSGGKYRVQKKWCKPERLRVGTVDAFQGKEFDVVFLSLTRSNDRRADNAEGCRGKYGFLMLPNRLCVAMSRQMRLLVVVGDSGMVRAAGADQAIKPLVEFWNLTGGPHGAQLY